MFDLLKLLFTKTEIPHKSNQKVNKRRIQIATCALLLELANADDEFTDAEQERIISILKTKFNLSDDNVDDLIKESEQELKESIDLWQFTHLINQNFSEDEKVKVLESAWKVIFADGKLDKYEDYIVHKISNLLGLKHEQLISTKLNVSENEAKN